MPAPGADTACNVVGFDPVPEEELSGVCSNDRGVPVVAPAPTVPADASIAGVDPTGGGVGGSRAHSLSSPVMRCSNAPDLYTRTNFWPFEHEVVACSNPKLFAEAWISFRIAELQFAGKSKMDSGQSKNWCKCSVILLLVAWSGDLDRSSEPEPFPLPPPVRCPSPPAPVPAPAPAGVAGVAGVAGPPSAVRQLMVLLMLPASPSDEPFRPFLYSTLTFLPFTSNPCDISPNASLAESTEA